MHLLDKKKLYFILVGLRLFDKMTGGSQDDNHWPRENDTIVRFHILRVPAQVRCEEAERWSLLPISERHPLEPRLGPAILTDNVMVSVSPLVQTTRKDVKADHDKLHLQINPFFQTEHNVPIRLWVLFFTDKLLRLAALKWRKTLR
jgi:hypothetical protein